MSEPLSQHIIPKIDWLRSILSTNRNLLLFLALILFVGGTMISVQSLELTWSKLRWSAIFTLLFLLVPISLIYGAVNMMVLARSAGLRLSFATSLRISSFAQLAEFLPVPGGAIVRGGFMMQHGVQAKSAFMHVVVNALLWVLLSAAAAGIAISAFSPIGFFLVTLGGIGAAACAIWIWRVSHIGLALAAFGVRIFGLLLVGLRVFAAFTALNFSMSLLGVYPFAFASIMGSASSLAPGGLGVSEALSAVIATAIEVSPSAAFLAVGIDRICGLVVSGIASGFFTITKTQGAAEDA